MLAPMRLVLLVASFSVVAYGDDITIPLGEGSILIEGARFIRESLAGGGSLVPELSFTVINQTSSPWKAVKLQFDMGGICNGEPRQWSRIVVIVLGWMSGTQWTKEYKETIIPLVGRVDGCRTEIIRARLLQADNSSVHIDGVTGEQVDFEKQLLEIEQRREAEAAARAEQERIVAEAQAKKDAADEARRKRLAAEQKRKDAEAQTRYAKIKAEEDARAAEERRKIRAACTAIYKNTVDKKISDLTVGEEQQVRACQALGLYPPN
jgi:hypothetical protein